MIIMVQCQLYPVLLSNNILTEANDRATVGYWRF